MLNAGYLFGVIDTIFTHMAVCRPFAAGDRDQARRGNDYRMGTGELSRTRAAPVLNQRAKPGVASEHIRFGRILRKIFAGLGQNELNLVRLDSRLVDGCRYAEVGRAHE